MIDIDAVPTWVSRAILVILYLNKGEISKQKLTELLYLIYRELKEVDPLEDLDFYINMKTKRIEIFTPDKDVSINDILQFLFNDELINIYKDSIYLTEYGYRIVKELIKDPKFKDEIEVTIRIITQYKDMSEYDLINLILENLKHS